MSHIHHLLRRHSDQTAYSSHKHHTLELIFCQINIIITVAINKLDAGHREAVSTWPKLIIAYDDRRHGEMWPELIIACDVRGRGLLQTDRRTDRQKEGQKNRHHNLITYCVFYLYRRGHKNREKVQ